jgi:branched-chain amino acid transport system permease protein
MSFEILAQTFINGLFLGGTYALFAGGLTLIYGVMYLINFAHGEFLMIGMYVSYWAFALAGIDPYLSVFLAAMAMFILGVIIQRVIFKPVLNAPLLNQILLTLGLSTLLMGLAQFFWGAEPRSLRVSYAADSLFTLGGLIFNLPRSIAMFVALTLCVLLYLFLTYTKNGKAIRACSQSREAAQLMGINVTRINMLTFGIGAAMVGIAGALITPSVPINPTVGQIFGISAFVIVVMGTMGNVMGAFVGALIIGVAEAYGGLLLGGQLKQVVSMAIFILILLFLPQGLFGRRGL